MSGTLEGTVALVTGASSGIGGATAAQLAGLGAHVVLVARREDRLIELAETVTAAGGSATTVVADIGDEAQAVGAVDDTVARLGRLDIVVNNAGLMLLGPVVGADSGEWRQMVQANLLGLMYVTNAALPHLLTAAGTSRRQVADIVNVSSVAGRFPRSGSAGYNASKHAVNGFSEALRQEVTSRFVRVSVIEPGAVSTELAGHNRPEIVEAMQARFGELIRLEAADIADAIAYVVTRPRHVAINEVLVRPTEQV